MSKTPHVNDLRNARFAAGQRPYPPGTAKIPLKYDKLVPRRDVVSFFYPTVSIVAGQPPKNAKPAPEGARILTTREPEHIPVEEQRYQRDLFLLGLQGVQQADSDDPWSFYQIGGIHGLPYQPYDGDDSTEWLAQYRERNAVWWGGYCHHGDILFPTWHRPYVLLFERAVIKYAVEAVNTWKANTNPSDADYQKVLGYANNIRVPYLDWAGAYVRTNGLPSIFTDAQVEINFPSTQTIPNPLRSFMLPEDLGVLNTLGAQYNPYAKPNYVVPPSNVFTPAGYGTVRYPTSDYTSNFDAMQVALMRGANLSLRSQLYACLQIKDWARFSNHYSVAQGDTDPDHKDNYGHYSSVEFVHDMVHDLGGGPGGQLAYPDVAGLDPLFFFHHCNVDRIIALWQRVWDPYAIYQPWEKLNNDAWMPRDAKDSQFTTDGTFYEDPNTKLDETTELRPFRIDTGDGKDKWFTSKDVRNVEWDLNYTYYELQLARLNNWDPSQLLSYLLQLYKPLNDTKFRWYVNVKNIPKLYHGSTYSIRVFIDLPSADASTPTTDVHFGGSIFIFARSKQVQCKNCKDDTTIQGSVEITNTLLNLGIASFPEIAVNLGDLDPENQNTAPALGLFSDSISLVYVASDGKTQLPAPPGVTQSITWTLDLGTYLIKEYASFIKKPADVRTTDFLKELPLPGTPAWKKGSFWGVVDTSKPASSV